MVKYWINQAVKHKGRLREYVKHEFGAAGFTERDTIQPALLKVIARAHCPVCFQPAHKCVCPSGHTRKMANLAVTLARLRG